ncbi:MAG: glycosyltransferase [Vicinamibacterales bacterium]
MAASPLRILHAIHDFLPQAQAGSEIYAHDLCRAQMARGHNVTLVCATFDPARPHGSVHWRVVNGIPVAELTNNWDCSRFEDTYRPPLIEDRLASVLQAVQPQVLHVHNLLNLSFNLPAMARAAGARVVATLHDYTLVCPSGGQRVHRAEAHVCHTIEPDRCARCFGESPFGTRAAFSRLAGRQQLLSASMALAARAVRTMAPRLTASVASRLPTLPATPADITARLDAARQVFEHVDLIVAPSRSMAEEYAALGAPPDKLRVSDYGFTPRTGRPTRRARTGPLRIGFVGTPVWHKGLHVLVDAARLLPPERFTLAVHGDLSVLPDYVADQRERSRGLPIDFAGPFARHLADAVYDALDLLVVPSIWLENSPLVVHEAFMAGVPVVASRIGGLADLIQHGRNGLLFEPGNANALAAALRALLDDAMLLQRVTAAQTPVKSLDDDAGEWDAAYARVLLDAEVARP